ncbi:carbohydrate kinase family protein [Pedococcus sp. 5OH_020]|uniref:carbohydrate kinase family protein n=1 Tax=Pedococcus sp. 5OH_020 TaxID=2989814 RepID=UPI0022E9A724|nr:carbohydrate kinase family protein [Pedococcus sp. 5OH_020]
MARVAVTGHLCVDLIAGLSGHERIDPGQLFEVGPLSVRLGGSAGNTGGDLVELGVPVDVVATVGDDDLGILLQRLIATRTGMTPRLRRVGGSATSYSLVFETPHSDRTFWHHVGSNAHFDGSEVEPTPDLALVHVGYPNLLPALVADDAAPWRGMLGRLRTAGVTTSVDLAVLDPGSLAGQLDWASILRATLSEVDVITPSVDDLISALPGHTGPARQDDASVERAAEMLLDWGAGVVLLSAGPRGAFLRTAGRTRLRTAGRGFVAPDAWADVREWVAPYPVTRVATTTGAGDAATAGLLRGLLAGLSPRRSGALAMACAASVVSGRRPTPEVLATIDEPLASACRQHPGW